MIIIDEFTAGYDSWPEFLAPSVDATYAPIALPLDYFNKEWQSWIADTGMSHPLVMFYPDYYQLSHIVANDERVPCFTLRFQSEQDLLHFKFRWS